jgi:hypothetical protein
VTLAVVLPAAAGDPIEPPAVRVMLPMVGGLSPLPPVEWDGRLNERGASIVPAEVEPGQGYWRLVRGVWYAENEPPFAGQHHIYLDALDQLGAREPGVPIDITSLDGTTVFTTIYTELKPGEPYAGNFPMYVLAPAYRAVPTDGQPADAVTGLGLGSVEQPEFKIHTSYGFVWEWTIARRTDFTE